MKQVNSKLLLAAAITALLAGCDSGGINVEPKTVDNSVDNSTSTPTPVEDNNPCASIVKSGQTLQGEYDAPNCYYSPSFVDAGNNLTTDLYIPALDNGGVHVFEGSLFVGKNYDNDADMQAGGISEGGDGPTLTVQAGATIAFPDKTKFMVINRGSQLIARGSVDAPITFTSVSDAVDGTAGPEDVSLWGGIVINGFGVTNKCAYTGSVAGGDLATSDCHVEAEGSEGADQSNYGGANNDDNSGDLEYVIVKHTGAQVANGDELNGISWGAVGRGTVVKNVEAYSTYDDGMEFFGGAVNIENYLALYVRDDSIDIDEGYSGTITNSLVIQSADNGANCIESDGIGSYKAGETRNADIIAAGINSRPTITGLTCILSPNAPKADGGTGTHDYGAGWRFREGIMPTVKNSMVISSYSADTTPGDGNNYCLRIDDAETLQGAEDDNMVLEGNIFACEEKTKGNALPGGQTIQQWVEAHNNQFVDISGKVDPTANADTGLQLLAAGMESPLTMFSIDPASTMMVGGAAPSVTPEGASTYLGALSNVGSDWTKGWTYGLHDGNRAESLWIEK
ncbi:serine/threonine protein kinase [Microbulbifer sp. SAOS-129_SWC]|uniref:serine/threonine protein kinase n=1 Tax=Microbulbifer sp. SAOS-129_SWC TaxID=3145235 RepID=UPI003217C023